MRRLVLLVVFSTLVASSCGGSGDAATPDGPESPAPATTSPADTPGTTVAGGAAESPDDAVAAPDFTLLLGSGETFVLSEAATPVYLVFWAEW